MNIVIGDYNINIKRNPVLNRLKPIEYYLEISDLFLETYTDLSYEDIDEILLNDELANTIVKEVYKKLNINDEQHFIKIVNNTNELLNSIDGLLIMYLERYYECNLLELIKMTSEELLTLFVYNLRTKNAIMTINPDELKNILSQFYSEETVNGFIENCCQRLQKQAQDSFEKEIEQLNNI